MVARKRPHSEDGRARFTSPSSGRYVRDTRRRRLRRTALLTGGLLRILVRSRLWSSAVGPAARTLTRISSVLRSLPRRRARESTRFAIWVPPPVNYAQLLGV